MGNTSQISYVLNEAPSTYPVRGVVGGDGAVMAVAGVVISHV